MGADNKKPDSFADTFPRWGLELEPLLRTPGTGSQPVSGHTPEAWPEASRLGTAAPERILTDGQIVADGYRVGRLLGSGGMGEVYECVDLNLGRTVALKLTWPGLSDDALVREARILAAFAHPALVTVHGMAFHHGRACMVMERLLGSPLANRIPTKGGMDIDEVLAFLGRIAEGLRVIHGANLAHRDLKPANVMVTASGRVVLMDMGIARQEREVRSEQLVSGSVPYMAPETLVNDVRVGEAHLTDIYALGITAFQMLTSQLPYDAEDLLETAYMHIQAAIPDVRELRPEIPSSVAHLVTSLMAKSPADRPAHAEEVTTTLRYIAARRKT